MVRQMTARAAQVLLLDAHRREFILSCIFSHNLSPERAQETLESFEAEVLASVEPERATA